jgi:hypothetical protein
MTQRNIALINLLLKPAMELIDALVNGDKIKG